MSGYWRALVAAARGTADQESPIAEPPPVHRFTMDGGDDGVVELDPDAGMKPSATPAMDGAKNPSMVERSSEAIERPTVVALHADGKLFEIVQPLQPIDPGEPLTGQSGQVRPLADGEPSPEVPMWASPVDAISRPLVSAVTDVMAAAQAEAVSAISPLTPLNVASPTMAAPMAVDPPPLPEAAPALPIQAATIVQTSIATPVSEVEREAVRPVEPDSPPSPILISIDRIDIRIGSEPAAATPPSPRRAAPVIGLDDFLRRSAEWAG